MSNSKRRGRKRKAPDTFNDETTKQPQPKKRKLKHRQNTKRDNKRNTKNKKKDDKSQSVEPKSVRSSSDPFKNTTVPNIYNKSNNNNNGRRHSHHSYNDDDDDDDDDEEDDDLTSSESYYSPTHDHLLQRNQNHIIVQPSINHKTRRSLPCTPRKISGDKKLKEPKSQSAKRSISRNIHSPYSSVSPYSLYHHNRYKKHDTLNTPPPPIAENDRKQIPNLHSSQESIGFTPEPISPSKKRTTTVIPVAPTPIRTNIINNNDNEIHDDEEKEIDDDGEEHILNTKKSNDDILNILMFMFIGFIVGFIVAFSVYRENELLIKDTNPMRITKMNDIAHDGCWCDITRNKSSSLCNPCMDQYWSLQSQCNQCYQQRQELNDKIAALSRGAVICRAYKQQIDELQRNLGECEELHNKMAELGISGDDINCSEYKEEIDELQHNLGECNVEYGTCEQKGRQKDKLDEMRIEEIEKQKQKFSLCNQQLKRYKEAAKRNKANKR